MNIPTSVGDCTTGTLDPKNLRWVAGVKPMVKPFGHKNSAQLGYVLKVPGRDNTFTIARQPFIVSLH